MASALWEVAAAREAEALILELGIKALPVSPFAIAQELEIEVKPLPGARRGVSGMLLHFDGSFGIAYATYIDNDGFKHFSIGHELGHLLDLHRLERAWRTFDAGGQTPAGRAALGV